MVGNCSGKGSLMFPRHYDGPSAAKAVALCETCPVCEECADGAISRREKFGIWGGLTPERIDIIAKSRAEMLNA